jgi:hypothetical protein
MPRLIFHIRTSIYFRGAGALDCPTNPWRLDGTTSEALSGAASVVVALRQYSRTFFHPQMRRIPLRSLFAPNRAWFGNHHYFVSEEVPAPKLDR